MSRAMLFDMIKAKPRKVRHIAEVDIGSPDLWTKATPFVFSDDAVAMAVALREETWRDVLIDAARLPLNPTWIEYSPRAKLEAWRIDEKDTADRTGHMIFRDPKVDGCVWMITYDRFKDGRIYQLPYCCAWSMDGRPVGIRVGHAGADAMLDFNQLAEVKGILLTGDARRLPQWSHRFGGVVFLPLHLKGKLTDTYVELLREHASVPTLAMALLAILSLKTREEEKVPRGTNRQVYRGSTFLGSAHTVVHLRLPLPRVVKEVRGNATDARRRWHMVREHPRTYHRGTSLEFTIIVQSHPRGDETLGRITHDYVVTRKKEPK